MIYLLTMKIKNMRKKRYHIVFFTGVNENGGITGNLSYGTDGIFWKCLYPINEEVIQMITEAHPTVHSITVTNIILLSKRQFRRWNKKTNLK